MRFNRTSEPPTTATDDHKAGKPSREALLLANMPTGDQFELPSYADLMRAAQVRDMTASNGDRK